MVWVGNTERYTDSQLVLVSTRPLTASSTPSVPPALNILLSSRPPSRQSPTSIGAPQNTPVSGVVAIDFNISNHASKATISSPAKPSPNWFTDSPAFLSIFRPLHRIGILHQSMQRCPPRDKKVTKSSAIDDMAHSQRLLFNLRGHKVGKGHIVRRCSQVHSPAVGDSDFEETHRLSAVSTETSILTRVKSEESVLPLYPLLFALSNPGYDVAISLSA
ncbi:hypothetical protein PM082_004854 [Marasmius tenuissimus]|nr:hypothetical protein PM082_004854 [Marasmius tenuissimus]